MKRAVLFAALTLLFLLVFSAGISASESSVPDDIEQKYGELYDRLPDSVYEYLPPDADGSDAVADAASLTGWDYIFAALGSALGTGLLSAAPMLAKLIGLLLLSAIASALRGSVSSPSTGRLLSFCSVCAVTAAVVALQYDTITAVSSYLRDLNSLVTGMLPIITSLYAAGGNVTSAAVSGSAVAVFLSVSENLLGRTVIPFAGCCLLLVTTSAVAPQVSLRGMLNLIKKTYTTIITFTMTLLGAVLAAQNTLAVGSDSISLRAAKFAAGSAIPVVGGSVGESLKTLSASIGLLRRSFGVTGIILILLLTLPTLASLLLTRLVINLSAAAAELLGCETESRMLTEIAGIYACLSAVVCACSLMFVFILTILAGSVPALA